MGNALTSPVTNKRSNQGEGLGLRYGLSSMQGWRSEMEDAHDVKIGLKYGLDDWSFFAVFDGHAGKRAAAFAAWNLLDFILRDSQFKLDTGNQSDQMYIEPDIEKLDDALRVENSSANKPSEKPNENEKTTEQSSDSVPKSKFASFPVLEQLEAVQNAIKSGFLRIDQSMRDSKQDMSGCTAICTLISPTHLFIANCGDSRAVLYDGTLPKFVTDDHKPYKPRERQRILNAGGFATQRINGTLAVSRALGDFEFKKNEERGPCEQLVSPEPEVTVIERHFQDEFLILACDGIWDVMNNDDLCEFIRYKLNIEENLEKICSSVLDVCLNKGSRDNMSIIIVVFENAPRFSKSACDLEKEHDEELVRFAESIDDHFVDFEDFLFCVKQALSQNPIHLPPGAGFEAKYDVLREVFDRKVEKETEIEKPKD